MEHGYINLSGPASQILFQLEEQFLKGVGQVSSYVVQELCQRDFLFNTLWRRTCGSGGIMADWCINEARQKATNRIKIEELQIDISHEKIDRGEIKEKFGRECWKVLIYGEPVLLASFFSDSQIKLLKTQIEPRIGQIMSIDTFKK